MAALFFDLELNDGTINDMNPRLVNFYEQIRDNLEEVIERLRLYNHPESNPDPSRDFAEADR